MFFIHFEETTAGRSGCGRNVAARGARVGDEASGESQADADSRVSDAPHGLSNLRKLLMSNPD